MGVALLTGVVVGVPSVKVCSTFNQTNGKHTDRFMKKSGCLNAFQG